MSGIKRRKTQLVAIGAASKRPHDKILKSGGGKIDVPAGAGVTYGWQIVNDAIQVATTIKGLRWNLDFKLPNNIDNATQSNVVFVEWFIAVVKAGQTASSAETAVTSTARAGLSDNTAVPAAGPGGKLYQPEENCIIAGSGIITPEEGYSDHGSTKGMRKLMPGDNLVFGAYLQGLSGKTAVTPVYLNWTQQYVYLF